MLHKSLKISIKLLCIGYLTSLTINAKYNRHSNTGNFNKERNYFTLIEKIKTLILSFYQLWNFSSLSALNDSYVTFQFKSQFIIVS